MAQLKLQPFAPGDIEDVAIESLEALVEKVHTVSAVEALKPLAASIARHQAASRLRCGQPTKMSQFGPDSGFAIRTEMNPKGGALGFKSPG